MQLGKRATHTRETQAERARLNVVFTLMRKPKAWIDNSSCKAVLERKATQEAAYGRRGPCLIEQELTIAEKDEGSYTLLFYVDTGELHNENEPRNCVIYHDRIERLCAHRYGRPPAISKKTPTSENPTEI